VAPGLALAFLVLAAGARADVPESPPESVPLRLANQTVFHFSASALGFAPREREAAADRRLRLVLEAGGPGAVTTRAIGEGTAVEVDGKLIFVVTPSDVEALGADGAEFVATAAAEALRHAIAEEREEEARSGARVP